VRSVGAICVDVVYAREPQTDEAVINAEANQSRIASLYAFQNRLETPKPCGNKI